MSLGQVPGALKRFALYFFDSEERPIGPTVAEYVAHKEMLFQNGLKALDPGQKRELAAVLDQCLDGTHSEEELLRLWKRTGARTIIEPVSRFFRDLRSRLRALGY